MEIGIEENLRDAGLTCGARSSRDPSRIVTRQGMPSRGSASSPGIIEGMARIKEPGTDGAGMVTRLPTVGGWFAHG